MGDPSAVCGNEKVIIQKSGQYGKAAKNRIILY
jgi:hypothetical protein